MKAVILAAGVGKRLKPFTDEHPKCLLQFDGQTLLGRHLDLLSQAGVDAITVVTGHLADQVKDEVARLGCSTPVHLLLNTSYRAGSALSLLKAAEVYSKADSLIMDADILYGGELLSRIIHGPGPNCLVVDPRLDDSGEEVKVAVLEDGCVWELGKKLSGEGRVAGESVGIFKFGCEAGNFLAEQLERETKLDSEIEYEPIFNHVIKRFRMNYVSTGGLPWTEIDFWEDVERAKRIIFPRLMREGGGGAQMDLDG